MVPQRSSPAKHLYHVTPQGRKSFQAWLREAYPHRDGAGARARYDYLFKNEFLQKCGFFAHLDPDEVEMLTRCKLDDVTERLADLEGVLERMESRDVEPYRRLVVEYGIRYQKMWRDWLLELLARTGESAEPSETVDAVARPARTARAR